MKFKVLGSVFLIFVAAVFAFGKPTVSQAAAAKEPAFIVNYTLIKTGGYVGADDCISGLVDLNGNGILNRPEGCTGGYLRRDVTANGPLRYTYIAIVNVTAKYLPTGWHKCMDDIHAYKLPMLNFTNGGMDRNMQTGMPGALSDAMIFKNEAKEYVGSSTGARSVDWYGNNFYYFAAENSITKLTFTPRLLICGPSKTNPSILTWNVIQSKTTVTLPVLTSPLWEYIDEFAFD